MDAAFRPFAPWRAVAGVHDAPISTASPAALHYGRRHNASPPRNLASEAQDSPFTGRQPRGCCASSTAEPAGRCRRGYPASPRCASHCWYHFIDTAAQGHTLFYPIARASSQDLEHPVSAPFGACT